MQYATSIKSDRLELGEASRVVTDFAEGSLPQAEAWNGTFM